MRLKADLLHFNVGADHFVVDPDGGAIDLTNLYAMNEASAMLWREFQDIDFDEADMVERLCAVYDVTEQQARSDVHEQLAAWRRFGLLE